MYVLLLFFGKKKGNLCQQLGTCSFLRYTLVKLNVSQGSDIDSDGRG